jgi:threonylcarbamoyladenosine tRNA methylthiotransferase MtaB
MNIYLDTIGCRLNQSEIETFARQFRAAGHTLVASPDQADLVVINTCTVTSQAASDSRQKIRQAARLGAAEIVVTGCWATMEPEAAAALPRVSHVIANLDKDHLVANLFPASPVERPAASLTRQPLPGAHQRTRAFIKVQDGCDNRCTYCITCLARGPSRSQTIQTIQQDVAAALAGGALEIVLTGVHLGAWGVDLQPASELMNLIQALLADPHLPRLRLSSLEPWDLGLRFFELWQDARMCRHLHLPLQSGCAATLRRMARKTTPQAYAELLQRTRAAIPGIAITTDIIVGFPGESEAEFAASQAFIRSMEFARGHVFSYSARPGTAAARMPDQVPYALRKARSRQLRQLFAQAEQTYQAQFTGQRLPVLWESSQPDGDHTWQLSGLTDNYLRVTAQSRQDRWNQISLVELVASSDSGMQGIICDRSEASL